MVSHEHDLLRRLKDFREDQLNLILGTQDEKVSIEKIKAERNEGELTFMKAQI